MPQMRIILLKHNVSGPCLLGRVKWISNKIGTGCETAVADGKSAKRLVKINGDIVKSQISLNDYLSVSWLTPQMDRLFVEGVVKGEDS